ncbi:MAG: c-type cytochrome [Terriglobales bacterium]
MATLTAMTIAVAGQGRGGQMTEQQRAAAAAARDRAINPEPPPDPAAAARGKALFGSTCAFCHGADATGQTGPNLLDVPLVITDKGGDNIGPFLKHGIPDQGMPAFTSVTAAQAADISAFLHDRIRLAADRFAQERPQVVVGNVVAGKAYFDGAGRCATCHSPTGDMAGIGKKFQPADLEGRILSPLGYRGVSNQSVTVDFPSGESVTGRLVRQDEFFIDLINAQGWEHSYPAAGAAIHLLKPDPMAAHKALMKQFADQPNDAHLHDLVAYLESLK